MDRSTAAPGTGTVSQPFTEDPGAHREVAAWVALLLRTIKTCRLYDAANPAVVRFRDELSEATAALLQHQGTLRLDVQSAAFEHAGRTVFESQSRDDNLPGVFHRDGVRALDFHPGISGDEVVRFLDLILRVTESDSIDDDLVTLLWEANLPHVVVSSVPLEGDVDGGGDEAESDPEAQPPVPWPGQAGSGDASAIPMSGSDAPRSDDWSSEDGIADPETVFEMLESVAVAERSSFESELAALREQPLVTSVVEILADSSLPEQRRKIVKNCGVSFPACCARRSSKASGARRPSSCMRSGATPRTMSWAPSSMV